MQMKSAAFTFQTECGVADPAGYDINGLFARLTEKGIGFAVYKNCNAIAKALVLPLSISSYQKRIYRICALVSPMQVAFGAIHADITTTRFQRGRTGSFRQKMEGCCISMSPMQ